MFWARVNLDNHTTAISVFNILKQSLDQIRNVLVEFFVVHSASLIHSKGDWPQSLKVLFVWILVAKDHVNIFEIPDSLSLQIHIDRSFGLCLKFEVQWEGLSKSRAAGVEHETYKFDLFTG